jgi:hypothetical protein
MTKKRNELHFFIDNNKTSILKIQTDIHGYGDCDVSKGLFTYFNLMQIFTEAETVY